MTHYVLRLSYVLFCASLRIVVRFTNALDHSELVSKRRLFKMAAYPHVESFRANQGGLGANRADDFGGRILFNTTR